MTLFVSIFIIDVFLNLAFFSFLSSLLILPNPLSYLTCIILCLPCPPPFWRILLLILKNYNLLPYYFHLIHHHNHLHHSYYVLELHYEVILNLLGLQIHSRCHQ